MVEFLTALQAPGGPPAHMRMQKAPEPVAIKPSGDSGGSRNDTEHDPAHTSARDWLERLARSPSPDEPTGPPPTFETDVLEAQAAQQRDLARGALMAAERRAKAQARADGKQADPSVTNTHSTLPTPGAAKSAADPAKPDTSSVARREPASESANTQWENAKQAGAHSAPAHLDRQI